MKPFKKLRASGCIFTNPDTSIFEIRLRDSASAGAVIGKNDRSDSDGVYRYYSKLKEEILTLTQHPGDINGEISIFKVEEFFRTSLIMDTGS